MDRWIIFVTQITSLCWDGTGGVRTGRVKMDRGRVRTGRVRTGGVGAGRGLLAFYKEPV